MNKIDLHGLWTLLQEGYGDQYTATIPGDNISALIENKAIPHPYFGRNELEIQWIGERNWIYRKTVQISEDFLSNNIINLYCDRVDTLCEIRINEKLAGKTDNSFRLFHFNIKSLLKPGDNTLEFRFLSPVQEGKKISDSNPYPVPTQTAPVEAPYRNMVRKVQCHSGWDWGPCLVVSGIYGDLFIEGSNEISSPSAYTRVEKRNNQWLLKTGIELYSCQNQEIAIQIECNGASLSQNLQLKQGDNINEIELAVPEPELWWPRGYGNQSLYPVKISVGNRVIEKKVGFRTSMVRWDDDEYGRSMTIEINGVPVFCKGANWIPTDALPANQDKETTRRLLGDAVKANMNTIRVWGGGQYEDEYFYGLCDELGLLVWQDMMFACSLYPATPEFLGNVELEIEYQVKRLMHHPSIALWCGNNENIGALEWYAKDEEKPRYLVDYDRLNEGVVGKTIKKWDPTRTWWSSSPSAGEGDYSDCWHDDSKGDMHYWSVWHEGKSFDAYYNVIPRFCSEFGFQSFPGLESVKSFTPENEINLTAPTMEHHQRHPRGNSIIIETLSRYYRFPHGLDNFLYLSQVQQAFAIQTAVEYWRSNKPRCMGALYWQLNDVWPVASWASIEYDGRWKMLHYKAARFFSDLIICGYLTPEKSLIITTVSDLPASVSGTAKADFLTFSGKKVQTMEWPVTVTRDKSELVAKIPADDLPIPANEGFVHLSFIPDGQNKNLSVAKNIHFLDVPKNCLLNNSEAKTTVKSIKNGYSVTLTAEYPLFEVALIHKMTTAPWSDNCFWLLPGESKTVTIETDLAKKDFEKGLRIKHLGQSY